MEQETEPNSDVKDDTGSNCSAGQHIHEMTDTASIALKTSTPGAPNYISTEGAAESHINASNNSDVRPVLCKDTKGFDNSKDAQEDHELGNDSVISSDISVNNSVSTPTSDKRDSDRIMETSTPNESQPNDSGIQLEKSVSESNPEKCIELLSSNGILNSEKNNASECDSQNINSQTVKENQEKSSKDSEGRDVNMSIDEPDNYEKMMEDMISAEIKETTKSEQDKSCDSQTMKTGDEQMSTDVAACATSSEAQSQSTERSSETKSTENATETREETARESTAQAADNDDSSDLDSAIDSVIRLRRRFRRRRLNDDSESSSSDTSSDGHAGPGDVDKDSDEDSGAEEQEEEEDDRPKPKDKWSHIQNLRKREFGFSNTTHLSHIFRTQCGASLNLVQRLECHAKLDYHKGCVNALHFNRSGTLLASGSDDLEIAVWNWMQDAPYFVFESGHRSNVFQCKFMPYTGDTHIVSCARDGQVRLAELSSTGVCKGTKKLAQHRGSAHKLALLEDSSHELYSCGEDAVVYQIDLREPKAQKLCTAKEKDKKVPLYSIHANPFKSYEFCTGGRDHYIRVYDKRMVSNEDNECTVKKYCPHHLVDSNSKANVTCAVYNWNGSEVLGTYNDDDIYMFDNEMSEGAEYIHRYKGHRNNATVKGVNYYGPHSEYIVSGSDCGHVFLWERDTERIVNFFHADEGGVVNVLEPHPHMPMLATSGLDSDVKLFMPTAKEAATLKGLAKRMKKNKKEREEERSSDTDMMDGRMLWFLMQHLRRVRRERPTGGGDGDENEDSDHSDSDRDSEDSENSEDGNPVECMPS